MSDSEFWVEIDEIIDSDFSPEALSKLDRYVSDYNGGRLIFERFSSQEQLGCSAGGSTHVAATILSRAKTCSDCEPESFEPFKTISQRAQEQAEIIERHARSVGVWIENINEWVCGRLGGMMSEGGEAMVFDNGMSVVKTIGLNYYILPNLALDRISLHNAYFQETAMTVIGFGRDGQGEFKILVEQPFIRGTRMDYDEIEKFTERIGFELKDRRSWTYINEMLYLSDLHDENVLKSEQGNIFVIDCDIRLNTPDLRYGGKRSATRAVRFVNS